jgi:magnesium transporter
MPMNISAAILKSMTPYSAVKCFENIGAVAAASFLEKFPFQIVMSLLRLTDTEFRREILGHLDSELSTLVKRKLNYPEGSAGALADPYVLTLPEDISIAQAMVMMKTRKTEMSYYLFILNRDHVLTGVIDLRDIMFSDPEALISDIMKTDLIKISSQLGLRAIADHPGWNNCHTLPVVENDDVFMGVLYYSSLQAFDKQESKISERVIAAGNALGELYQIGLTGLMRSANPVLRKVPRENTE